MSKSNGKIRVYPEYRELEHRVDGIEDDIEEINSNVEDVDDKCDKILVMTREIKSDVRLINHKLDKEGEKFDEIKSQVGDNSDWISENKRVVAIVALIVTAGAVAALTGLDLSSVL